jgi:succinoglycan biosynthesis transport protein ExoP
MPTGFSMGEPTALDATSTAPPASTAPAAGAVPPHDVGPPHKPGHLGASDPAHDGLARILARQWPVVVVSVAVAVLLGVIYLMAASRVYTATAKLLVTPMDRGSLTGNGGEAGSTQAAEDYLETQCVVIKSDAVLALALDDVRDTRTLTASPRPLDVLRDGIDATVSKKGQAIDVSFDSKSSADARRITAAVVDAYQRYNKSYWHDRIQSIQDLLSKGSTGERDRLKEEQDRLYQMELEAKEALTADPEHSQAHQQVVSLREAKSRAELDAIAARTAYQGAARGIAGDPVKQGEVERELRTPSFPADPQRQLQTLQDELQRQQARLADARSQYMANHPVVKTIESRIDQLTVDCVVAAKQWQDAAEGTVKALARDLADAQQTELEFEHTRSEYAKLQDDVHRLEAESASVNATMSKNELAKGAGFVNIAVLDEATVDLQHVKPGRSKTLAIASLLGLLGGAGLACLRDWSDDRFRTLPAVRAAAGAPVLGAIPNIPASIAASAADRGQVVHFDPFGDASESYRTLRTALQFGMPARTKTLLITSPTAGDGKSTVVSNLAIAMAQANRRVLVVDADLRAPVQHRLFGLPDRVGLAGVLDGSDALDDAIQRTNVEGLDVLPAGPIPSNPAEMINHPAFSDYLNELADRYDLVLVDSPPVTAVTDARILAALVDASILVVRLGTSTRRHTEAARDALRGVGARLVGVVVNGVGRGGLASASGYYGRSETALIPPGTPATVGPASAATAPAMPGGGRLAHDPLTNAVLGTPPSARR